MKAASAENPKSALRNARVEAFWRTLQHRRSIPLSGPELRWLRASFGMTTKQIEDAIDALAADGRAAVEAHDGHVYVRGGTTA